MTTSVDGDVLERIKQTIVSRVRPNLDPSQLSADTPLIKEGLGLDSATAVELIMGLEEVFDIEIDDDEVNAEVLATVGTLAQLVSDKVES